VEDFIGQIAN